MRTRVLSAVALLLVVAFAGATDADQTSRPFRASLEGFANPAQTNDCTIINDEVGTGQALHAGAITLETTETVNLCAGPDGAKVTGEFVLTAANGDQIFGVYETIAILATEVTAFGNYTITGGTGRFADATGQGVISAVGSLAPPFEVTGSMVGQISY